MTWRKLVCLGPLGTSNSTKCDNYVTFTAEKRRRIFVHRERKQMKTNTFKK